MITHEINPRKATEKRSPSSTHLPQLSLLIADDIREEIGGKLIAIGLYTDRVVVMDLPSGIKPTQESPLLLPTLAFVVIISGVTGRLAVEITYSDPTLPKFGGKIEKLFESESAESTVNITGRFAPLPFGGFGTKLLSVRVGDVTHPFEFRLLEKSHAPPKARFLDLESPKKAVKAPRKARRS